MVIAPANTGRAIINKNTVIRILQIKRGIVKRLICVKFLIRIEHKKLILLRIDEAPAICKDKIVKSILPL
jgi:hypothetical protein